ncbi:MAG: acetyl-coenzyme A synthetase N-terminal domain-containing protein, partial [Ectothiorhodospira sp.]
MGYAEVYDRAVKDPEGFWAEAARGIDWDKPWDRILDADHAPFYHW